MLTDIILFIIGVVGVIGVLAAQKGFHYSVLVYYRQVCPDHPELPSAVAFVERFGGMKKVNSAATTGFVFSLFLLAIAAIGQKYGAEWIKSLIR